MSSHEKVSPGLRTSRNLWSKERMTFRTVSIDTDQKRDEAARIANKEVRDSMLEVIAEVDSANSRLHDLFLERTLLYRHVEELEKQDKYFQTRKVKTQDGAGVILTLAHRPGDYIILPGNQVYQLSQDGDFLIRIS